MAGGDRLHYTVTALASASLSVTSQAAERIYRARTAGLEEKRRACQRSACRIEFVANQIARHGVRKPVASDQHVAPFATVTFAPNFNACV